MLISSDSVNAHGHSVHLFMELALKKKIESRMWWESLVTLSPFPSCCLTNHVTAPIISFLQSYHPPTSHFCNHVVASVIPFLQSYHRFHHLISSIMFVCGFRGVSASEVICAYTIMLSHHHLVPSITQFPHHIIYAIMLFHSTCLLHHTFSSRPDRDWCHGLGAPYKPGADSSTLTCLWSSPMNQKNSAISWSIWTVFTAPSWVRKMVTTFPGCWYQEIH